MAFTGFKSVMCGIQCLENKHNTDSEASVNHFPAQPAANQDYTEQFLLLLSPFTPFILEESECISHGLRRRLPRLQILSAGFSSESAVPFASCRSSSMFLGWVTCKSHPSCPAYSYWSAWAWCHNSPRMERAGKWHGEGRQGREKGISHPPLE